jgi:sulfatase maturation enzyme AslB (radical SAM superfamily)
VNKETFCSLPFTEIFLGPDGGIKPCCSALDNIGSLHKDRIKDIIASDVAKSIRHSIINNEWHPNCIQCRNQSERGVQGERKDDLDEFILENGIVDQDFFKLKRLDLRWSNTCNLSCTYCYEYFSSKWAQIKGIKVNTIKDENENSLFLLIEQHKDTINSILMLGGEPLLQKQNAKLIEELSGRSFYILTNFAVPLQSNKIGQQLIKEPLVKFAVSFETVGNRYEYVRHGASWKVFVDNVDYLQETRPDLKLECHSLYSIYSAFNLVEFYKFVSEKKFENVMWHLLESSGESDSASVLNLSDDLKQQAIEEIEKCELMFPHAPGIKDLADYKLHLSKSTEHPTDKRFVDEIASVENLLTDKILKFKDLWPNIWTQITN